MKAVVLAAGEGRRLRPLTGNRGKGMLPVGNRPVISYVIEALAECNIREIVVVVGYQKERVMNLLGDGRDFGVRIEYVIQKFQLGTAHALFQAREHIDGQFLIVPGDSLVEAQALKSLTQVREGEWGMLVTRTSNSSKYGIVDVIGDRLQNITERPKLTEDIISSGAPSAFALALWEYQDPTCSTLINTGTYLMDKSIFNRLEALEVSQPMTLTSCISEEARKRKVNIIPTEKWLDAVYPWDLLILNEHVLSKAPKEMSGIIEEGVVIKGHVKIGPNSRIRANTVIEGPTVIGEGCTVGPCAYIGANSSIGENCSVGPFSVIKGSLIMDDVVVGAHSSIYQSVVAQGSTLGDFFGVEQGGYNIKVEKYTSSKTLGAVVGEDCEISHHVSMSPGVILGNGCRIGPMRSLRENLPDGTQAV
jgi:glucose-1-phosphate thymidylyltransferase